jgi:4-hydroxy-4-methyl-2-oxoglutarate aldolase
MILVAMWCARKQEPDMIGDPVALRIRRDIARPSKALLRRFAGAQTSFVADAQQGWNCLHHSVKPLRTRDRFVGSAVTASGGPRDNLAAMAMLDVARPGDVLVIATGADESGAVVGDHWAAVAKGKGVVAVVTDGLVRDRAGIEKLGPPTFCRGISPNAGYRNGPGEVNATVSMAGVSVSPGDILIGDADGVVVVPLQRAEAVAKALQAVKRAERATEKRVLSGTLQRMWDPDAFTARGVEYLDE